MLQLLKVLVAKNVQINAKKSVFGGRGGSLRYLGSIIDGRGISGDVERIKALKKTPKPDSFEKLRSFLEFAQYYSKFVPNFAQLAQPLFDMANFEEFSSAEETSSAYETLLQAMTNGKVPGIEKFSVSWD